MTAREGVIKFEALHRQAALSPGEAEVARELEGYRRVLFALGLVGRDPARYDGAAFGNVSARVGSAFVISGTQTSGAARLSPRDYAVVEACAIPENRVQSRGEVLPSSEAMTHAAVYAASPRVRCVLHVHAPVIFQASLPFSRTPLDVAYGTPAMAAAVTPLVQGGAAGLFVTGGHEDGVVSFGAGPAEAAAALVAALASCLGAV